MTKDKVEDVRISSKIKLPDGWKYKLISSEKYHCSILTPPNGAKIRGINLALQYLTQNNYPIKDIENMRLNLSIDGWRSHQLLPFNYSYKTLRFARKLYI